MVEGDRSSGAIAGVNRQLEWRCYCCDLCCAIRVSVTDGLVVCTGVDLSRGSDALNEFWFCRILQFFPPSFFTVCRYPFYSARLGLRALLRMQKIWWLGEENSTCCCCRWGLEWDWIGMGRVTACMRRLDWDENVGFGLFGYEQDKHKRRWRLTINNNKNERYWKFD